MEIKTVKNRDVLTFYFDGELDEHSAKATREKLDSDAEYLSFSKIIFDFKHLNFMDSTGIGVILGRYKKLKPRNIEFFIKNPSNHIDKILKTSGIYTILKRIG